MKIMNGLATILAITIVACGLNRAAAGYGTAFLLCVFVILLTEKIGGNKNGR